MNWSLARAREDLRAGRAWKARDRLTGMLRERQDPELLDLLATVHHEMGDLPAAGALWFVTGRDDVVAHQALAAWRERHGNDEARWHSIPAPVRRTVSAQQVDALEKSARQRVAARQTRPTRSDDELHPWREPLQLLGCGVLSLWLLAMIAIGLWTVVRWTWS